MEKQLQIDLAKSEHMRLHHEGNHSSALDDMSDLEKELQKLREASMQTNMDLNHANASLEKLQSEYNQLKSESKESADVIAGLRDELTNAQHDADLLRKDMAKLDKELEHANALYAKSEEELKTCLLYTSPSPRDRQKSRMPSSA